MNTEHYNQNFEIYSQHVFEGKRKRKFHGYPFGRNKIVAKVRRTDRETW